MVGFCSWPNTRDVVASAAMCVDELLRLHEHTAGAAGRVEYASAERALASRPLTARRIGGVELTAQFPLGSRELAEEVLVHPAENVQSLVLLAGEVLAGEGVDESAQASRA